MRHPLDPREVYVRHGKVRQAGADDVEGHFADQLRTAAEQDLFVFTKAVLGRDYLTPSLHKPVCDWLTQIPPRRKGLLMPRETGKTSLVSHALPLHILIQPQEQNLYFPGELGAEQRIILCTETEKRGKDALGVQRAAWESNETLRALWPHVAWPKPRRDAQKWNDVEYTIPRPTAWPDPSVRTIGVGGAITGAHPSVLVKDDLVTIDAANSNIVMQAAIEWHRVSRSLINKASSLEFIIGTRWAVHDLYSDIMDHDPSVEWMVRHLIEDGVSIYPELFTEEKIAQLRAEYGVKFELLYMNTANDPLLCDFDMGMVRWAHYDGQTFAWDATADDALLRDRLTRGTAAQTSQENRGQPVTALFGKDRRRQEYLRLRAT